MPLMEGDLEEGEVVEAEEETFLQVRCQLNIVVLYF
jgi:hypothetical protein